MASMSAEQARVFGQAARHFNVFILVRATNAASLAHVGKPYATAKRLDCKAKTADFDWSGPGGLKRAAGLVINPTVPGAEAAFRPGKLPDAIEEWLRFRSSIHPSVRTLSGLRSLTYIPDGGQYFIDLEPASERYGCVMFAASSLISAGKCIHGDFDLYGIVPVDEPATNVQVKEEMLGQPHFRSPELLDVQMMVNRLLGVPMVLHGAQEGYKSHHTDEVVDVFHPNGQVTVANGAADLAMLYRTLFRGRGLFTKQGKEELAPGVFSPAR